MLCQKDPDSVLEFAMGNIADEVWKARYRADTFPVDEGIMVSVINLDSDPPYEHEKKEIAEKFRLIRAQKLHGGGDDLQRGGGAFNLRAPAAGNRGGLRVYRQPFVGTAFGREGRADRLYE